MKKLILFVLSFYFTTNIFCKDNIIEIAGVYYDVQTNEITGFNSEAEIKGNTRFICPDPLAEKYYQISPYAYCVNNPINAIDPDGRLVIFINGFHRGDGGESQYWEGFDEAVMAHLNESSKPIYRDGSVATAGPGYNFSAKFREKAGRFAAKRDAQNIINAITDNKGELKETIKIIAHSMGAAYAKGYIKVLLEYFKEHNIPSNIIEFEADFAPYQPDKQKSVEGVKTYQFSHSQDKYAGKKQMEGAEYMDTSNDTNQGHGIASFINQVKNLPEGKYKIENGQIVPL